MDRTRPSRRDVVVRAGAGLAGMLLTAVPTPVLAAPSLPSLEEIFGARRFAVLRQMYRDRYPPMVGDWHEDSFLGPDDRFLVSEPLRTGLAAHILTHAPFEFLACPEDKKGIADMATLTVFTHAGLMPAPSYGNVALWGETLRWRRWVGETGWRAAGWPPPESPTLSRARPWRRFVEV